MQSVVFVIYLCQPLTFHEHLPTNNSTYYQVGKRLNRAKANDENISLTSTTEIIGFPTCNQTMIQSLLRYIEYFKVYSMVVQNHGGVSNRLSFPAETKLHLFRLFVYGQKFSQRAIPYRNNIYKNL